MKYDWQEVKYCISEADSNSFYMLKGGVAVLLSYTSFRGACGGVLLIFFLIWFNNWSCDEFAHCFIGWYVCAGPWQRVMQLSVYQSVSQSMILLSESERLIMKSHLEEYHWIWRCSWRRMWFMLAFKFFARVFLSFGGTDSCHTCAPCLSFNPKLICVFRQNSLCYSNF